MSLILRTQQARPLTHDELDANFKYVNLKPWDYNDYLLNQLVYFKNNDGITVVYRCIVPHIRYVYDPTSMFGISVTVDGVTLILWEAITNTSNYLLSLFQFNEYNFVDSQMCLILSQAEQTVALKTLKFTDLTVAETTLVLNISSIASKHYILQLPSSDEINSVLSLGKKLKIIMKSNGIVDKNKNFMISTKWIQGGSVNKLLSVAVNTKVDGIGYFMPLETLETVDLVFDGIDWLAVSTSKQQYVLQNAQNFSTNISQYINRP